MNFFIFSPCAVGGEGEESKAPGGCLAAQQDQLTPTAHKILSDFIWKLLTVLQRIDKAEGRE